MKVYINENIKLEYTGTVIYKDCFVGENSIHSLVSDFKKNSIDFSELYGCFSIAIHNMLDGSVTFFCDNIGYMPIYYTNTGVPVFSRSLIDMVERTKQTQKDIDWNAVFSFLEFGFCYSDLTFFKNIKKCTGDCIYRIENGCLHILKKDFKYPKIESINDYVQQLKKILSAFKQEKVLFDITGGTDSRLLVCLAESIGLNYELFVRGHKEAVDIKIAKEIAVLLNKPLHVMEARAFDKFTTESLLKLLTELDGMYMPLEGFQLLEAYKKRQLTGCAYNIGGLGGEYYKNSPLLLPYKKLNDPYLLRVLNRRRNPLNIGILNPLLHKNYDSYNASLIKNLNIGNHQKTYLNWYRFHAFPKTAGALYAISAKYTPAYAPLTEVVFDSWIYALPFRLKIFKLFYRKIINYENRYLGDMNTTLGFSLSLSPLKLLKDFFVSSVLLFRKVIQRFTTKSIYLTKEIQVSDALDELKLKNSCFLIEVNMFLHNKNILDSKVNLSNMSIRTIDRFLLLWSWLTKIQ